MDPRSEPPDRFCGAAHCQNEARSDEEHEPGPERVLLRGRREHSRGEGAEEHECAEAVLAPEEEQADHRQRRVEGGPPISQDHGFAEQLRHPGPEPEEVPGFLHRPGREPPADSPEVIHERLGRARDEANGDERRRGARNRPDRHGDPQRPAPSARLAREARRAAALRRDRPAPESSPARTTRARRREAPRRHSVARVASGSRSRSVTSDIPMTAAMSMPYCLTSAQ